MKKLIFLVLFPILLFAQTGKSVWTQKQLDSLAKYVDKTTSQTITGQKNFSGTVKFRSDTSITMGGLVGSYALGLDYYLKTANSYQVPLRFNVLDQYTAPWTITSGEVDFAPSVNGKDHVFNIGYNWSASLLGHPQFGQQMEATYEMTDTTLVSEWFSYYNSKSATPTYAVRPFQLGTFRYGSGEPYRYTSTITTNADAVYISDETNTSLIEFRTQTYGATSDYSTKSYGSLQNAFGNSMMYIVDSLWIFHNINNMRWLWQANSVGSAKELMRIDNNDRLLIAPSTDTPIDFQSSIYGNIYWTDEAGTGEVPIYKEDGTDRIFIGGNDGMITNELEVTNIPQDTIGLDAGQFYLDNQTGVVKYTLPENILPEGNFTTWNGILKQQMPEGFYGTFDTLHAYVEQVPSGKLHYVNDGTDIGGFLSDDSSEVGLTYGYSFIVSQVVDTVRLYITDESAELISATGFYSGTSELVAISRPLMNLQGSDDGSAAEVTLDDVRIWVIGGNIATTVPTIYVKDTTSVTDGYTLKYIGGEVVWSPDISTSGSGLFNPDGTTIDTTVGGLARVLPSKVAKWDSVTNKQDADADLTDLADGELTASKVGGVKDADYGDITVSSGAWAVEDDSHNHVISNVDDLQDSLTAKANTAWFAIAPHLIDDSLTVKMNRAELGTMALESASTYFDTLSMSINIPDTVIAGDNAIWKIPNNITITEIASFTNTGTVTFNLEERGETTPNTSGTDVIGSDLVADTNQEETVTFTNATLDRDDWLALVVASITGDPTLFGVTIRYIKTN